ncbi:MAG: NAD-dependent epimerase/dehydratase family protein [Candidatus Lokiarchaeia archaeon]
MSERVLVTGGCGFVGSHLVRKLVEDFKVVVLDNLSNGMTENIADMKRKVRLIVGDVCDSEMVRGALKGCKYIFHLVAQGSVRRARADSINDASTNIIGTLNVLRAAEDCEKVIIFSSAAVYGEPIRTPIDEEHPRNPLSMYGVSKLASENYARVFYENYGLPITVLRPFNIYGLGQRMDSQYSGVINIFAQSIIKGENPIFYGDGTQTRDFVHVSDVVEASILAAESEKAIGQIFNVATGKATTINEIASELIQITGNKIEPVYINTHKEDIKHSVADISKIQKTLSYKPKTTLTQGLKNMIKIDIQ